MLGTESLYLPSMECTISAFILPFSSLRYPSVIFSRVHDRDPCVFELTVVMFD
jgi:hypothetical protein